MQPRATDEKAAPLLGNIDEAKGALFHVSDRLFRHGGNAGIGYRNSKNLEDKADSTQRWNTFVKGFDEGDGWIRVGSLYLPMELKALAVVSIAKKITEDELTCHDQILSRAAARTSKKYIVVALVYLALTAITGACIAVLATQADRMLTATIAIFVISPALVVFGLGLRNADRDVTGKNEVRRMEEVQGGLSYFRATGAVSKGGTRGMHDDIVGYALALQELMTKDYQGDVDHVRSEIAMFRERINDFTPFTCTMILRQIWPIGPESQSKFLDLGVEHVWKASGSDISIFQKKLAATVASSFLENGADVLGIVPRVVLPSLWWALCVVGVLGFFSSLVLMKPALVPSSKQMFLPDPSVHPSEALASCPCVVFFGKVTLAPMWYTFGTLLCSVAGNFVFTFLKAWKSGQWKITDGTFFVGELVRARKAFSNGQWEDAKIAELEPDGKVKSILFSGRAESTTAMLEHEWGNVPLEIRNKECGKTALIDPASTASIGVGKIMMMSLQVPSAIFTAPSVFASFYSFLFMASKAAMLVPTQGILNAYLVLFMPFVNSGAPTQVLTAMLAPSLTSIRDLEPHMPTIMLHKFPGGFRTLSGLILLLVLIPGLVTIVLGQILFAHFSVPMECLCALFVVVCFPNSEKRLQGFLYLVCAAIAQNPKEGWRKKAAYWSARIFKWLLMPMLQPIDYLCKTMGLLSLQSPLVPSVQVALISLIILVKAFSWQYAFNSTAVWLWMGVEYGHAVSFSFSARHTLCQICLLQSKMGNACDAARLAWVQVLNIFF